MVCWGGGFPCFELLVCYFWFSDIVGEVFCGVWISTVCRFVLEYGLYLNVNVLRMYPTVL